MVLCYHWKIKTKADYELLAWRMNVISKLAPGEIYAEYQDVINRTLREKAEVNARNEADERTKSIKNEKAQTENSCLKVTQRVQTLKS